MNIAEHVQRGAASYPDRIALLFEGQTWTYRELDAQSSQAAGMLAADGLSAGDRIALYLPNVPGFAIAYLGILKLGAIAVSISTGWKHDELHYVLKNCQARAVVTTPDLREHVPAGSVERIYVCDEAFAAALASADRLSGPRAMEPGDPAVIVYTSGTTGRPKGAVLSHSNVVKNIEAKRRYLGIRADDRGMLFLPLYHCFGQNAVFNAMLHAGAAVVLHRRFDLERVLRSIADHQVTMFFGVPANFIVLLARLPFTEVAGVRYWFSAAAPLPLELENAWRKTFGAPIFQGYGALGNLSVRFLQSFVGIPAGLDWHADRWRRDEDCRSGYRRELRCGRERRDRRSRAQRHARLLGKSGRYRERHPRRLVSHRRHRPMRC